MAELDEDEMRYLRLVKIVNTFAPMALRLAFPRMWDDRFPYDKWSDEADKRKASGELLLKGDLKLQKVPSDRKVVWKGRKVTYDGDLRGHCRKGFNHEHTFRGKIDFIASELGLEDGDDHVKVDAANKALNIESKGTMAEQVARLLAELGDEGKRDKRERQIGLDDPDNPFNIMPFSCQVKVDFQVDPNTGTATTILILPKDYDLCKFQEPNQPYAGKCLVLRVPRVLPPRQTTNDISADAEDKILKQGLAQWDITRFNWAISDQGHGLADDLVRKAVGAMNEVRNKKFGHAVGGKVDPDTFKNAKDTFIAMLEELATGSIIVKASIVMPSLPTDEQKNNIRELKDKTTKLEGKTDLGVTFISIEFETVSIMITARFTIAGIAGNTSAFTDAVKEQFRDGLAGVMSDKGLVVNAAHITLPYLGPRFLQPHYPKEKPHNLKADEKENLRKMLENLEKDTFLRKDLDEARKDQLRVLIPQLDMRSPESLKTLLKLWGLVDHVDVDEVTRTLKPAELATLVAVGESELFPHWSPDKRKQLLGIRKLLHSEWLLPHPKTETKQQGPAPRKKLSERQMQRAQKVRSARRHCTPSPSASLLARVPFAVGLGHRARSGQRARQSADARPGQTHDGQTNPNLREREHLSGPGPRR